MSDEQETVLPLRSIAERLQQKIDNPAYGDAADVSVSLLREAVAALREREQPKDAPGIRRFARDVLEGGFEGNTFDGADLQELGVKHGLLREVTVTEPCSTDGCACAEVVDFPTTCYRFTEVMQPPKATEQAKDA